LADKFRFFVTCARGTEGALRREIAAMRIAGAKGDHGGVWFEGPLTMGAVFHATGWMASFDQLPRQGVVLAIEEVNKAGGILGREVKLIELDGKTGHVIDFSVKHTRIRTASGQEYNLPNSRCIPSRRFPDGYVDNYVDIVLKTTADIARAKRAIVPVCRNISRRIEQVKDEAVFVDPGALEPFDLTPKAQSVIERALALGQQAAPSPRQSA
jgi:hypothetical protein